tara:strand:+ start:3165 stop:5015 length:1851 start_codon:yes stop_codon:yes gene_type:complete
MKNFLSIFALIFILSCDDVIKESESNKYGAIKLTFNKPSEELAENINNNRSMSQFADVDAVRITINNSSPVTVSIVGGSASYSKSGLSVGTASIKVELTGAGITKYTQTKSVTIIADQTASTSFNAFAITNQSINLTSSFQTTYDGGDIINLSWTNSHAEQPVNIERWDQVGGVWVKTKTVENDFVGTSYSWDTQGESSGESVKIRIQSTISNTFIDTQPFQLLSNDLIIMYNGARFKEIIELQDGSILAAGYLFDGSSYDGLLLKIDLEGNVLAEATQGTQGRGFEHVVQSNNGNIYTISNDTDATFSVHAFTQNLNYLSSIGASGVATGIATYTSNGSNYLAISNHYNEGSSYGENPGIISVDVSGGNFTYVSNWGWHQTSGDEYSIDIDVNYQNSIIISKYFPNGNSNGNFFNYYGWSNFNPSTGGTVIANNGASSTDISLTLTESNLTSMNADYFWISSEQAGLAIAALQSHVVNSQLTEFILDSEDSSFAMGTFYDEDNSSAMYLLAGDYYEPSNGLYVAALYFYNFNDELTTISYADYLSDKSSMFYDVSKIQGSYVASGVVLVNNEFEGLIYISNASSKSTKSVIEVNKTSITSKPEIKYFDVPKFNIE